MPLVLGLAERYPFHSRSVVLWAASVLALLNIGGIPKILDPVVRGVPVPMVNHIGWPMTVKENEGDVMAKHFVSASTKPQGSSVVTPAGNASRDIANFLFAGARELYPKNLTRDGVVAEIFKKNLDRQVSGRSRWNWVAVRNNISDIWVSLTHGNYGLD